MCAQGVYLPGILTRGGRLEERAVADGNEVPDPQPLEGLPPIDNTSIPED